MGSHSKGEIKFRHQTMRLLGTLVVCGLLAVLCQGSMVRSASKDTATLTVRANEQTAAQTTKCWCVGWCRTRRRCRRKPIVERRRCLRKCYGKGYVKKERCQTICNGMVIAHFRACDDWSHTRSECHSDCYRKYLGGCKRRECLQSCNRSIQKIYRIW